MREFLKAAIESHNRTIEDAIHRFRDCGVEFERFSIVTRHNEPGVTHLCIDGVSRFSVRIAGYPDARPH
jgi:hypothetical protein